MYWKDKDSELGYLRAFYYLHRNQQQPAWSLDMPSCLQWLRLANLKELSK
jgi:hypothetical protein